MPVDTADAPTDQGARPPSSKPLWLMDSDRLPNTQGPDLAPQMRI